MPEGQEIPQYDAQELADRLGLELRRGEGDHADWPVTRIDVSYFKAGDPNHSLVTRDGATIPKGVPVEGLRMEPAANDGLQHGPDRKFHRIDIPRGVPDGEGWLIGVTFVRMRPLQPSR